MDSRGTNQSKYVQYPKCGPLTPTSVYSNLLLFSCPVVSDTLWRHGLQYTRPPCFPPSPKICPSSCPLHQWYHPTISSSEALFSFCPQSSPASWNFPMSQLFASGGQNTGISASVLVFPKSIQDWFPLRLTAFSNLGRSKHKAIFSSWLTFTLNWTMTLVSWLPPGCPETWGYGWVGIDEDTPLGGIYQMKPVIWTDFIPVPMRWRRELRNYSEGC